VARPRIATDGPAGSRHRPRRALRATRRRPPAVARRPQRSRDGPSGRATAPKVRARSHGRCRSAARGRLKDRSDRSPQSVAIAVMRATTVASLGKDRSPVTAVLRARHRTGRPAPAPASRRQREVTADVQGGARTRSGHASASGGPRAPRPCPECRPPAADVFNRRALVRRHFPPSCPSGVALMWTPVSTRGRKGRTPYPRAGPTGEPPERGGPAPIWRPLQSLAVKLCR
jgi:hypothetical protein